jgi:signal transduction histidine kinase
MRTYRRIFGCLGFGVLLLLAAPALIRSDSPPQPAPRKTVLLVLPSQAARPGLETLLTSIDSELGSSAGENVSLFVEFLGDADLISGEPLSSKREEFNQRYSGKHLDAIIAITDESLRAVEDLYRNNNIPVVFVTTDSIPEGREFPKNFTVFSADPGFRGALRTALQLFPETRYVAVASGPSVLDRRRNAELLKSLKELPHPPEVIDLSAISLTELSSRVSKLPPRTILIVTTFYVDPDGRMVTGAQLAPLLSRSSNSPFFSTLYDAAFGLGMVGGEYIRLDDAGRTVARACLDVLHQAPAKASIRRLESQVMLDWRQLQRWHVPRSLIPAGAIVAYRQPTFWERNRKIILIASSVIVAQALVIALLLWERRRRLFAQKALTERLRFETAIAEISEAFANVPVERIAAQIERSVRRLVEDFELERGSFYRVESEGEFSPVSSWPTLMDGEAEILERRANRVPWTAAQLRLGRNVLVTELSSLPEEAAVDLETLRVSGIHRFLAVPLILEGQLMGTLCLNGWTPQRRLTDEHLAGFRTVAEILTTAIVRKESEASARRSKALGDAMLASLPGSVVLIARDGTILQTNGRGQSDPVLKSIERSLHVGANYFEMCDEKARGDREATRALIRAVRAVASGEKDQAILEYQNTQRPGKEWIEVRAEAVRSSEGGAVVAHQNVSEAKNLALEASRILDTLSHMQRVDSMSELASSIAHELNQPLAAILLNAAAAHESLSAAAPDLEAAKLALEDIRQDDERAGEVIRRIRGLVRKSGSRVESVSLSSVAAETVRLISSEAQLHIVAIDLTTCPDLPLVKADPVQLQQVVINLIVNAVHAVRDLPEERRRVSVSTFAMEEGNPAIEVRDLGLGVPPEVRSHIFEPFFSTKPEGLGLGLAISKSIVEAAGGRIVADWPREGGAVFRIVLPVETQQENTAAAGYATGYSRR